MYCCWPCSWLVSSGHVYVLTSVTTLSWIHQACNSHFFFNFTSSPFMPQSALVGAGASTDPIKVVFCSIGMFYHPLVFTMIPAKSVQLSFCEFLLVLRWQCVPGHHMVSLLSSTLSHGHRSTLSGSDMAQVANYFFCVHLIEFILRIWTYLIAEVTFSE